jgi:hypothetical protein
MEKAQSTMPKINPAQAKVEVAGQTWKHLVVNLRESQSIAAVRETPEIWTAVQADRTASLGRGDRVSLVSHDGLVIADQLPVINSEGGLVFLGAPLRMVKLEPPSAGLFSNGRMAVVPNGTGYGIRRLRDNVLEERIYNSPEAARQAIITREPVRV